MTKGKGELNKKGMSMMFLICVLFLYVCLPVGVLAAELETQAEAEISGEDFQLSGSEILSDGTSNSPEAEIFSSSDSALEAADFTDEPEEAAEQNDEILLTDNTEAVWVNNVDLITAADHMVKCGAGTASYDVDRGILTLSNATVDQFNKADSAGDDYSYIWLDTQKDCTIVLDGDNYIGKTDDSSRVGIKSQCNLEITGDGNLTIKAAGNNPDGAFNGILGYSKNIKINGTTIHFKNENIQKNNTFCGVGILNISNDNSITVSNSQVDIEDYGSGIGNGLGEEDINIIDDSQVKIRIKSSVIDTTWGIHGKDISVHQSTLNCEFPDTVEQGGLFNVTGDITLEQADVKAIFNYSYYVACIQCTGNISIKDHCNISSTAPLKTAKSLRIVDSRVESTTEAYAAFSAEGQLVITGDSDIIAHGYEYGLWSYGDISISGGKINADSSDEGLYGNNGIYAQDCLEISGDADVISKSYDNGIESGDMYISGGSLNAVSIYGNAISTSNLKITGDSNIKAKANTYGIVVHGKASISGGRIEALSSYGPAIFPEELEISGKSEIKAHGYDYGVTSMGDITISGGEIEAISSNGTGIELNGVLRITGGEIHAKGMSGCAGISAVSFQTETENAVLQIQADSMIEKNNAKIAFSDWSYYPIYSKITSWSSFIPETDDKLNVESGAMQNALNEVWLASPFTVTFDTNDGTGATETVKVYPGNKVVYPNAAPTRPGYYLSGWTAEDGSFFDINSTSVDRTMTLKASWSPIVYDSYYSIQASAGEHGTITPSGTISVREYTDQTFTFTPEEGYETAEVLVDGKKVEATDSYKFERVTSGHTISVSFLKKVPESYPDGTVAKPDGSFETPDGVVILPDGTVVLNDKDKTEFKPDSEGHTAVVNKDGTVTVQDGSIRNPDGTYARPAKPIIEKVDVLRNNAETILANESNGAKGYDYVISENKNCIVDKDYLQVNKNVLLTATTFRYVQKGTYYAYCHSWLRGSNGKKVFSQWSEPYEFTVTNYTPDTPSVVKVTTPKKGVVVVSVSVPKGAKGFDVILGREVKKVNGEKRPVAYGKDVIRNRRSTLETVTFTNVKPGKVYAALHSYSRVQDTNMKVFSRWSDYKALKVK